MDRNDLPDNDPMITAFVHSIHVATKGGDRSVETRPFDERLPGSVFGVIALVVFVGLIVLGIVGADGARYR